MILKVSEKEKCILLLFLKKSLFFCSQVRHTGSVLLSKVTFKRTRFNHVRTKNTMNI